MGSVIVKIRRLDGADHSIALPQYETELAAGADLRANFANGDAVTLAPSTRALIPTGLALEIPRGFEVQLRPRSGLALKNGIMLVNSPGTIDADYRGEVGVILLNSGEEPFEVTHGMRIAQMVLAPALQAQFETVETLSQTSRGEGGFGSTGRG